ncbi:alpha/beta hydrolase [Marinobacter sp. CHS3-4]|uniref:alpha/beta fold hydrolase n=1 Tax=Marinobacter sp. CHS3-4 TaxID=3045174 RepID=UPI0024B537AC|nr:alpha/beta hydrolase [Marinobacter sp. CHS3-4]MDI9244160.1 alpha/beta hydrolase [Marinobacter sp. CHS3-4]
MTPTKPWTLLPFARLLLLITALAAVSGCSAISASMEATPTMSHWGGLISMEEDDLKSRYTNEHSRFIRVNGYNIHYQDRGQGEPIILMHGIFSALQTWDDWAEELSKTHRVIALDMPGFGLTGAPEDLERFNEQEVVAAFEGFVDALGLGRVSLAGNSLGGFLAAHYAAKHPDRVKRLVLLDPFGYPQDTPWLLDVGTSAPVSFMGSYIQPAWAVTLGVAWVYGDSDRITPKSYSRYVHMNQRAGAKPVYMKTLELIEARADSTVPPDFRSIKAETLLMWGEEDTWVPPELAERWRQDVPDAGLVIYPTVGHIPMEELPKDTVRDAALFLQSGLAGACGSTPAGDSQPKWSCP